MAFATAEEYKGMAGNFIHDIIDEDLASGKHSKIVTRFPPEPNGYLHVGHAKSLCLNFGTALKYGGRCNLRYDDTNPAKEDMEFVKSIEADVNWLGFQWDEKLWASDYFDTMYEAAVELIKQGKAFVCFLTPEEIRESAKSGMFSKYGELLHGRRVTVGPLKLFKDGSLGARTALMRSEYADDPGNFGMDCMSAEVMDSLVSTADELGIQVVTHVIGDGAVEGTVESYEKVISCGPNKKRHALIHCQITDAALMERIRRSDIRIFYQPIFLNYDLHVVASRVGDNMASTSYAFGTAVRNGSHVSFGTDSPVEDINPFDGVFSAVTRKDLSCFPDGGFYPEECITVEQAVDAYTIGSAEAEFAESWKGRIAPGYVADMVILDRDIFTVPHDEIKDIRPVCTVFNGKIVYSLI